MGCMLKPISILIASAMTFAAIAKVGAIEPNRPTGEHDHVQEEKQKYTCSMHPEVITDHPGNCPKCGMKLVPLAKHKRPTANSDESRAGVQRSTRLRGATARQAPNHQSHMSHPSHEMHPPSLRYGVAGPPSHAGHEMQMEMHSSVDLADPMTREGSGTSW